MEASDSAVRPWSMPARLVAIALGAIGIALSTLALATGWSVVLGGVGVAISALLVAFGARVPAGVAPLSPAYVRYGRRLAAAMVGYVVVLVGALFSYHARWAAGPLGYVVAIAPAVPLLFVIGLAAAYARTETDEFARVVFVESQLWASLFVLVSATVWGMLEAFGKVPHVALWVIIPVWGVGNGVGYVVAMARYR
jgi:hypothetical protein